MDSVNDSVSKHTGFPHSEIAGYNGSYHLTDAYRRLARPSSPLTARASTVYAYPIINVTLKESNLNLHSFGGHMHTNLFFFISAK